MDDALHHVSPTPAPGHWGVARGDCARWSGVHTIMQNSLYA